MFFKGMTFGFMARHGYYSSDLAKTQVKRMAESGVEWVCVIASVWQETFYSTVQFIDVELTPSDEELIEIIAEIHKYGMKAYLRPMLQCLDGGMRDDIGAFPGDHEIIPGRRTTYWADWFANYQRLTKHYAALAQKTGCEAYCMDSELNRTIHQQDHWRKTMEVARKEYKGHLTCVMSTVPTVLETKNLMPNFWLAELDSFGLSAYPQVEDYPLDHVPTVPEMIEKMKIWNDQYIDFGRKFPGICYLGECGTASHQYASNMWEAKCRGLSNGFGEGLPRSEEEQANYLQAVLEVYSKEPWWKGLFWWKWDEHLDRPYYNDDPAGEKGLTIYGKKALEVYKAWKNPEK